MRIDLKNIVSVNIGTGQIINCSPRLSPISDAVTLNLFRQKGPEKTGRAFLSEIGLCKLDKDITSQYYFPQMSLA